MGGVGGTTLWRQGGCQCPPPAKSLAPLRHSFPAAPLVIPAGPRPLSLIAHHIPLPPSALPLHCCSYYGLKPDIKVIAPWREWDLNSRTKLIEYAEQRGIGVPAGKRNEPPFSMDANLLHISYEG